MAHHKNIIDKGSNYTRSFNKGSFVTIIHKICDRIFSKRLRKAPFFGVFRKLILTTLLFSVVGCGSKKKTIEITKEERHEEKDLSVFKKSNVNTSIDFLSEMSTYKFTPVDPKKPMKINGLEIDNAIVDVSNKKVDSTVQVTEEVTEEVKDKGEVKERKKEKNQYKEKQIQILWWQWVILIVGFFLIGLWVYFRATGKRIKFW